MIEFVRAIKHIFVKEVLKGAFMKISPALLLFLLMSQTACKSVDATETSSQQDNPPYTDVEYKREASTSQEKAKGLSIESHYPQLTATDDAAKKINQEIEKQFKWDTSEEFSPNNQYGAIRAKRTYDFTALNENFVSIIFKSDYNYNESAHPWAAADAVVFDRKTGERMFVDKAPISDKNLLTLPKVEILNIENYEITPDEFSSFIENASSIEFFINDDNSLGFLIDAPHYIGDYIICKFQPAVFYDNTAQN
ncbi:MAG: hypothetical protein LBM16_03720, partial [Clostridiales bacterium]|jgi:hypothetical protein|nr:hypothetical protein [Clostridiales bacterium]